MSKYVFKLKSVLNIKRQMEDNLKNELGKAVRKLENEKNIFRKIEEERLNCISNISKECSDGMSIESFKQYNSFIFYLRGKMDFQQENINFAECNVDKCRKELTQAMQERKILEKLNEKKYRDFLAEQNKEEQKLNNEIAGFKYIKSLAGD